MSTPASTDVRKALLLAGIRLAGRSQGLGDTSTAELAGEAGTDEKAFHDHFESLAHYRRELLTYQMDVVRAAVLTAAAGMDKPGFERLWRCVEAFLDANLRHPAMRRVAHDLRTDATAIDMLHKRTGGYAMVFKVELAAMGCPNPAKAARLATAMILEAAVAESEEGHAQPELRRALYAFLKGYCG